MNHQIPITVAYEYGIGPEIMDAVLRILHSANANIKPEIVDMSNKFYSEEDELIFSEYFIDSITRTNIFFKSLTNQREDSNNIEKLIEKNLGIYKYIFPYYSFDNLLHTENQTPDIIFILYNNYLYNEFEYKQTQDVYNVLNSFNISDLINEIYNTFEFLIENNRKKVSFFIDKDDTKFENRLFFDILHRISEKYTNIETEIIPYVKLLETLNNNTKTLDVIVINNISHLTLNLIINRKNSLGLYGMCGIGKKILLFKSTLKESFDIAGKNEANPTGLIIASIMMLNYIGQKETASKIFNALITTLKDGIHTKDIYQEGKSKHLVGTQEFADEIIKRLDIPDSLNNISPFIIISKEKLNDLNIFTKEHQELTGVDVYINWSLGNPKDLGEMLKRIVTENLRLEFISNKGKIVYPTEFYSNNYTDMWICRYLRKEVSDVIKHTEIIELLSKIYDTGFDFVKIELLYNFNGKPGYTKLKI
ncbi:MAG: isocitrate/isopropylmalate family dehydrogenase [Ignavibacteria bacterium]|nr:isocitrate/isopropylmalate family dehydrogenase [Ignavibacteria bacterium]